MNDDEEEAKIVNAKNTVYQIADELIQMKGMKLRMINGNNNKPHARCPRCRVNKVWITGGVDGLMAKCDSRCAWNMVLKPDVIDENYVKVLRFWLKRPKSRTSFMNSNPSFGIIYYPLPKMTAEEKREEKREERKLKKKLGILNK